MTEPAPVGIGARGATGVGVASLVAAVSSYAVLVVASRSLTTAQNAEFLAFWGLVFFLFGTLGGLQSEVTRSVHVARTRTPHDRPAAGEVDEQPAGSRTSVLVLGLGVGAAGAAVVALTSLLWADAVLGPDAAATVLLVALGVLLFAGHSTVAGILAGRGQWTSYARLVGGEALLRLLLTGAAVVLGAGLGGLHAAVVGGAATWLLLLVVDDVRAVRGQRADTSTGRFLAGAGQAMVGAASSAALVVGFPVLVRLTVSPEAFAQAAPLLLAVTLTRAPLLIPLTAYQGVAITHFVTRREEGARPLLRLAAVIGAVAGVGAVAAALVGPWLMAAVLGPAYRLDGLVLAALTLAAAAIAVLTLTGAAVLALEAHRTYAVGWLAATAVSAAVLLGPGGLAARVVVSLALGPLVGVVIHALGLRAALRVTPRGRR